MEAGGGTKETECCKGGVFPKRLPVVPEAKMLDYWALVKRLEEGLSSKKGEAALIRLPGLDG